MKNDLQAREIITYEYRVRLTPEYTSGIDENWELHKVFLIYLDNGYPNYALVFRRKLDL